MAVRELVKKGRWKWRASLLFKQYKTQVAVNAFCLQFFLVIHSVDPQAQFPGLGLALPKLLRSYNPSACLPSTLNSPVKHDLICP